MVTHAKDIATASTDSDKPQNDDNRTKNISHDAMQQPLPTTTVTTKTTTAPEFSPLSQTLISNMELLNLGTYRREHVSNIDTSSNTIGRQLFDVGLRLMMSYQHEMAAQYFYACIEACPHAALAHGLSALCHGPNYNFKGDAYYESACHVADTHLPDAQCMYPSQQVADRHSAAAIATIDELKRQHRGHGKKKKHQTGSNNGSKGKRRVNKVIANTLPTDNIGVDDDGLTNPATSELISDVEVQLLTAIRILTGTPGVDPGLSDETVGRPYANAMRKVYNKYPNDPDIVYFFAESLLVLNAWQLYEYPSGKALSPDVDETREVLERALQVHSHHPGLIHMYVHLSEMAPSPQCAIAICEPLRTHLPHAGHLIHMPSHIDVLIGDYNACLRTNLDAIKADMYLMQISPTTAGRESFYFGYIVVRG
jgi:hypothetical protein